MQRVCERFYLLETENTIVVGNEITKGGQHERSNKKRITETGRSAKTNQGNGKESTRGET